jgi:choice-of-anchor B domain-containing protein
MSGALVPAVLLAAVLGGGEPPKSGSVTRFASAIAVFGDELFVARAASTDPRPAADGPRIFVYRKNGNRWTSGGGIDPGVSGAGDFGVALAAGRDVVAVGAPGQGAGGSVVLFERRNGRWSRVATLTSPVGATGAGFGVALALDGDLLVVGSPGADSARGAVYAFRRDPRSLHWSAAVEIARGDRPGRMLGGAVATAGGRVLVGGPGGPRSAAGIAVVYRAGGPGGWSEEARLSPSSDSALGYGSSVLLGATEAFVGAPASRWLTGEVFAFRLERGSWRPTARIAAAAPDSLTGFGAAMVRVGTTLAVGAPSANHGEGRIHLFDPVDTTWAEVQALTPPAAYGGSDQRAGWRLAAGKTVLAATAPTLDFGEGGVVTWAQGRDRRWTETGSLADMPTAFAAITGGERRCASGRIDAFECREVDLLSFLPLKDIGGRRGIELSDIWGWTDSTSGREFALVGRMDGTAFVEVTDPARPRYVGELPMHAGARANYWRGIKVYRDHAFVVADGAGPHGMQVFDLRQLLSAKGAPLTFAETAHYPGIASAHTIAINEATGYAYPVGANGGGETCGGALHMIDIRTPERPIFAGCFADPTTGRQRTGYIHETVCVVYRGPDARYTGREICFNASETAVGIADVTDKAKPAAISTAAYPNVAYAHQGWLTEDQKYFYLNDEGDELGGLVPRTRTLVWDVAKLDEPVLVQEFLGTTEATDHNLYIRGKYMFQSNYVAGLRVIDISDPVNPRETGYLDTVPYGENRPGYAGSWTNYPFFKSGTIVVTSEREGLFVVRHRPQELTP